ncbi:MAG: hypothetical protein EOO46_19440 [Flavobacterium sp.]|nr:MAG: hypothetical protein EOO46_19440 [Flavobacterium sp.]
MKKYTAPFLFLIVFSAVIFLVGKFIPSPIGKAGILILFIAVMVFNLIKEIALYIKTRKGLIVDAELLQAKPSEKHLCYDVEIKYHSVLDQKEYVLKTELLQVKRPNQLQLFKVWINENNPEKSVLLNRFGLFWVITIFLGIGLIAFFSYWVFFKTLT